MLEERTHPPAATAFSNWLGWALSVPALLGLACGLAWVSTRFQSLAGWFSFFAALLLGAGLLVVSYRLVRVGAPSWLFALLVGAALLRLALGVLWFGVLPGGGYGSPAELNGYIMVDAFDRDQTAWKLAQSPKPLWTAFVDYHKADQYGGLLFLSALIYRGLQAPLHQPLLVVVFTAAFSALGVAAVWAFARRTWDERVAALAAWVLALYPEAVLMGSSQMREAFLIPLAILAVSGLARYARQHSLPGLIWALAALLVCLPFSPPAAGLLLAMLVILSLFLWRELLQAGANTPDGLLRRRPFWLVLALLALLILAGMYLTLRELAPEGVSGPVALLSWWVRKSAEWQAHLTERSSGWIQKIFYQAPAWAALPLHLLYGMVRPFLPAAVFDVTGAPLWRAVMIWRASGWAVLLALLAYALLRAWRRGAGFSGSASFNRGLSVLIWLGILVASFRGGADDWDNPRYRATFAGLQIALAAWAWVEQRRAPDPWLRRVAVGIALVLAWFAPWYLHRYIYMPWPVSGFFSTLGLGLISAAVYILWDWFRLRKDQ